MGGSVGEGRSEIQPTDTKKEAERGDQRRSDGSSAASDPAAHFQLTRRSNISATSSSKSCHRHSACVCVCVCAFTARKTHVRCKTNPTIFSCRFFLSCLSSVKKADKSKNVGERDGGAQLTAGRERRICLELLLFFSV